MRKYTKMNTRESKLQETSSENIIKDFYHMLILILRKSEKFIAIQPNENPILYNFISDSIKQCFGQKYPFNYS